MNEFEAFFAQQKGQPVEAPQEAQGSPPAQPPAQPEQAPQEAPQAPQIDLSQVPILQDPEARAVLEGITAQWGESIPLFAEGDERQGVWNTYRTQVEQLSKVQPTAPTAQGERVLPGEAGNAIVAGVRDFAANTADFAGDALGALGFRNVGGNISQAANSLPQVKTEGIFENITRDVTRFGLGFIGGKKVIEMGLQGAGATLTGNLAAGFVGDFVATGQNDTTLTDIGLDALIQKYPELEGPVVDYLRAKGPDSELKTRFVSAVEGLATAGVLEGLFGVLRHVKGATGANAEIDEILSSLDGGVVDDALKALDPNGVNVRQAVPDMEDPLMGAQKAFDKAQADAAAKQAGATGAEQGAKPGATEAAEEVTKAAAKERLGNNVFKDPFKELEGLRMSSQDQEVFKEAIYRSHTTMGDWMANAPTSLPRGALNYDKLPDDASIRGTWEALTIVTQDTMKGLTGGPEKLTQTASKAAQMVGDAVGVDYRDILAPLANLGLDAKDIAARMIAAKTMASTMARDVVELARKVHTLGATPAEEAKFAQMLSTFTDFNNMVKGAQTAAARVTSAGRIAIDDTISPEMLGKILEGAGGSEGIRKMATRITAGGSQILVNPKKLREIMQPNWASRAIGIHNEIWMNGILSGVKTHVLNIVGGTANTLLMPAEQIIGGLLTGQKRQIREGVAHYAGLRIAISDSLEAIWQATKVWDPQREALTGSDNALGKSMQAFAQGKNVLDVNHQVMDMQRRAQITYGDGMLTTAKLKRLSEGDFNAGMDLMINSAGKFVRMPSRFLMAEDEFLKQINYRAKTYATAVANTDPSLSRAKSVDWFDADKGKTIKVSPYQLRLMENLEKVEKKAFSRDGAGQLEAGLNWADKATFTNDLKADTWASFQKGGGGQTVFNSTIGESIQKLASKHPVLQTVALPFVRTPVNLMRNAWDHTPLIGQLRKQFWSDIQAGGERQATAMGKLATGSMMWIGAGFLASDGMITGGGPSDPDLRRQMMGSGWRPYSVRVENEDGTFDYIPFGRLDPFGTIFGLAADFWEISTHMDEGTREDLATSMSTALANNISNKTYLKGLTETLALMSSGQMNRERLVETALYRRVGSYIPSYMSMYSGNEELKDVRSALDAIKSRTPGFTDQVESKRDLLGDKVVYPGGWFLNSVNPFNISPGVNDPVRMELSRLADSPAGKQLIPIGKTMAEGRLDLTQWKNEKGQSAYDRLQEMMTEPLFGSSKNLHGHLKDLIGSSAYKQLKEGDELYPNTKKVDLINSFRQKFKEVAINTRLRKEYPKLAKALDIDRENKLRSFSLGADHKSIVKLPEPE